MHHPERERGHRPCLILLDLVMPGMNGLTFRQPIIAAQRRPETPALKVS